MRVLTRMLTAAVLGLAACSGGTSTSDGVGPTLAGAGDVQWVNVPDTNIRFGLPKDWVAGSREEISARSSEAEAGRMLDLMKKTGMTRNDVITSLFTRAKAVGLDLHAGRDGHIVLASTSLGTELPSSRQIEEQFAKSSGKLGEVRRERTPLGDVVVADLTLGSGAASYAVAFVVLDLGNGSLATIRCEAASTREAEAVANTVIGTLGEQP